MSAMIPTISRAGDAALPNAIDRPIGSSSGKYRRPAVSLMMMTGLADETSSSLK